MKISHEVPFCLLEKSREFNDYDYCLPHLLDQNEEYKVVKEYVNFLDQRVYIIQGISNEGRTKLGLEWTGYDAKRFSDVENVSIKEKEVNFALN